MRRVPGDHLAAARKASVNQYDRGSMHPSNQNLIFSETYALHQGWEPENRISAPYVRRVFELRCILPRKPRISISAERIGTQSKKERKRGQFTKQDTGLSTKHVIAYDLPTAVGIDNIEERPYLQHCNNTKLAQRAFSRQNNRCGDFLVRNGCRGSHHC